MPNFTTLNVYLQLGTKNGFRIGSLFITSANFEIIIDLNTGVGGEVAIPDWDTCLTTGRRVPEQCL